MRLIVIVAVLLIAFSGAAGQRIAIITPLDSKMDADYAGSLAAFLASQGARPVDRSLAAAALHAASFSDAFNLSATEAKRLAAAIGCEYLVIVRSDVLRRASFSRPDYFEAFAAIYLVSGRSGRLADWRLTSFEGVSTSDASRKLIGSSGAEAADIFNKLRLHSVAERMEKTPDSIEEVPDENSQASKGLRPPIPYRRIKPEYSQRAGFYNVRATVDALVDISDTGEVLRVEIVRWAGFDLDESVAKTIKNMNWRPAMQNGKPLAMRVLLRYNFKNLENEQ